MIRLNAEKTETIHLFFARDEESLSDFVALNSLSKFRVLKRESVRAIWLRQ